MISVHFNQERGILESVWSGDVDLKQILNYIDATRLNKDYPRRLKILTITLEASFLILPEDLPKIVEANLKSLEQYDIIIDGIVLENPHDTALSFLYQKLSATHKYIFKVFSTSESALNWLENY